MDNPFNNLEDKWKVTNMDDAHFYSMGTWADKPQKSRESLFSRIRQILFGWLKPHPMPVTGKMMKPK